MAVNFVKFQRGSEAAYNALKANNRVDPDTLYFLYDSANPELGGDLYLGFTLIGGTSSSSSSGASTLRDLSDVLLSETLSSGMILQYSTARNRWVSKSFSAAIDDLKNSGYSFGSNVTVETALAEGQTVNSFLNTISSPSEGDIAIVAGNPYVFDGTNWVSLMNPSVLDRVSTLESEIATIKSDIQTIRGEIDTKIAAANHLTYQVLSSGESLNDIDTTAADISKTVFLVPNDGSSTDNMYYEYMYINGEFEKLGSWETNLNGYVTTNALDTAVSNLQSQINAIPTNYVTLSKYNNEIGSLQPILNVTGKASTTIANEIVDIYERLQWNPISAS